ncbi:hypothetical protein MASR2M15_15580 [Anaerolineales bacterium]
MRNGLYILGELSDEDINWLIYVGTSVALKTGDVLIKEADQPDSLYILLQGKLSVRIGKGIEIAVLGKGDIVGEMSIIESRPTSASVVALEECLLLKLAGSEITRRFHRDIGFSARFHRALALLMAQRIRDTNERLNPDPALQDPDELGEDALDVVYQAGTRLDKILHHVQ